MGDTVASCNLELGEEACECRQVQQVFKNTADHLIQLSFDGKILKTTDEHPFYVVNKKDWVEARYLRIGDQLQSISGDIVLLDDISEEYGQFDVYNLDVQGNHNYYAADVLVHNCNEGAKVAARAALAESTSAVQALNLSKSLASEAQIAEVGTRIAGEGAKEIFRDALKAAERYGGSASDYVKMSSSAFAAKDGMKMSTHWIQNIVTGSQHEVKTIVNEFVRSRKN